MASEQLRQREPGTAHDPWDVVAAYAAYLLDGLSGPDHRPFAAAAHAAQSSAPRDRVVNVAAHVLMTRDEPGAEDEHACRRAELRCLCRAADVGLQLRLDVDPDDLVAELPS